MAPSDGKAKRDAREERARQKAKSLMWKKPIVKGLNLYEIQQELEEISDACEDIKWYMEGTDSTMLEGVLGDEDDASEFRMMFSLLQADCTQMLDDMRGDMEGYLPDCFDDLFVAVSSRGDGYLGFDEYEGDYYGLDDWDAQKAVEGSEKRVMRLTKKELLDAVRICLRVAKSYLGLRYRYDCLKAAIDILRGENAGYLQQVREIEKEYDRLDRAGDLQYSWRTKTLDAMLDNLPWEVWVQ